MQYLMVLLVMIGVVVLMIGMLIGVSYGLGTLMYARDSARAGPAAADPCEKCQADRNWYEDLPIWKRNVVTAWWLANRYRCAQKGCQ